MAEAKKVGGGLGVVGGIVVLVAVVSLMRTQQEAATDPKPGDELFYGHAGYSMPACPTPEDLVAYADGKRCRLLRVTEQAKVRVLERRYRPRVSAVEFMTGPHARFRGWVFTHQLCRTESETPDMTFPKNYR